MTRHECLWIAQVPAPKSYSNKPLPAKTDVVVVGGGYTGTSAALRLAKGGARVTLLEARTIGWGASSRNGGQALSCLHHTLSESIRIHGRDRALAMFGAAVRAADTVEEIVRQEGIECDHTRCGNIEAAGKPAHFEALIREEETLREAAGYEVRILSKHEAASELGTDAYHGLMINPRSGSVQPARFVRGMALAAERAGAELHEGTRVLGIERLGAATAQHGERFTVRTDRGEIAAKEVMLAANAWTGGIVPHFRARVFPVESFVIATEPLPEEFAQRLIPNDRVVYDTRKVLAYYRLSPEGRMVWGGEATFQGASPKTNIDTLRRGMARVFPELGDARIDYFWSGTLGLTFDENAHAGQVDGMWYAMCYVGHGVTLATYLGRQMADGILGREMDNPFADLPMPRVPLYQVGAWLENLGKAWYRFVDLIR
jgi:glycine/D-amino acid oxidase-like deaminating enzyme